MATLKVKRLSPAAHLPERGHPGDLGYDLFASESATIPPGGMTLVKTGVALAFPAGWGAVIKDRSSMARRRLTVSAGVIDHGYRGEILVALNNHSTDMVVIEPDQKIAQLVPVPVTDWDIAEATELDGTSRGDGGFGSTGSHKK